MTTTTNKVQLLTIFEAIEKTEGEIKEVLKAIADKRLFIDNHNNSITEVTNEKFALLILGDNEYVCPAYKNTYFCMNEMYVGKEDGYVHLSTWSVAGTICRCKSTQELIDACDRYNADKVCGAGVTAVIELS